MHVIDLHCDTLSRLYDNGESLDQNTGHVDLQKMSHASYGAQFFAIFLDTLKTPFPYRRCLNILDLFHHELEKNSEILAFAGDFQTYEKNRRAGKISAFLTIEDSAILGRRLERLAAVYTRGVRLITLTWNHPNAVGFPGGPPDPNASGLTSFGFDFLAEMNRLKMVVDVSHLSDAGFWDVVRQATAPFIASHSNARALCAHPRNVNDEMIRAIAAAGGVIGVNFYRPFLTDRPSATLDDLTAHIGHIVRVGGLEAAAIGSDFDGMDECPGGLSHAGQMENLWHALIRAGFSEEAAEHIFYKNSARVIRDVLS